MEPCVPSNLSGQPVEPERAPVAPRARRLPDGEVLPLEQIVRQFLDHHEFGVIHLQGAPGAGKTTALRHLAAVLPPRAPVFLFDDTPPNYLHALARSAVVVMASGQAPLHPLIAHVQLAPWCQDDVIEYLLASHPKRCAAVMARVNDDPDAARLGGSPMLWRMALDEFAQDDSLRFVASALRRRVFDVLRAHNCATAAMIWCLKRARGEQPMFGLPEPVMPVLAQSGVVPLLAAEHLADLLSENRVRDELVGLGPELVRETALLVRARLTAQKRLEHFVRAADESVPGAASILAAVDPDWTPRVIGINLAKAMLERVKWPGIDLSNANLLRANFAHADLSGADLTTARARAAQFTGAKLSRAQMKRLNAADAGFAGADLGSAALVDADLTLADLRGANLAGASLRGADLAGAKLSDACCVGAKLANACLVGTSLNGADFTRADFTAARLEHVKFTDAKVERACFRDAHLTQCDLEGVRAAQVDFAEADLSLSLLSASVLPGASFRKAKLCKSKLAQVEWEGADLRRADLRGATFHLGSCRSGLVGSAVPCEGSKTGFYTDELDEQQFKSPEEIRKANLRGADLRGAKLRGVDFYLVDLRDAKYTRRQARYFRKCGAIL
jgi:uncharacterized protein YjbI with pentapeptide repeats